jgi:cell fate (sporulation/competence/biofilm development) regulator YlbF (YheA/YmcA/DUF963 family)
MSTPERSREIKRLASRLHATPLYQERMSNRQIELFEKLRDKTKEGNSGGSEDKYDTEDEVTALYDQYGKRPRSKEFKDAKKDLMRRHLEERGEELSDWRFSILSSSIKGEGEEDSSGYNTEDEVKTLYEQYPNARSKEHKEARQAVQERHLEKTGVKLPKERIHTIHSKNKP